jgi:hypothetical protein
MLAITIALCSASLPIVCTIVCIAYSLSILIISIKLLLYYCLFNSITAVHTVEFIRL